MLEGPTPEAESSAATVSAYIGISGYVYTHWRGAFYPKGLAQRRWLSHAAARFNSIELNGTFYSLKTPAIYQKWLNEVPSSDFVFAIKGSRFITHRLRLKNTQQAMANFLASGVLGLGLPLVLSYGNCRPVITSSPTGWKRSWPIFLRPASRRGNWPRATTTA